MRILLDECVPRKLKAELIGHDVSTVQEMGWQGKKNGELLALVDLHFEVFLTVDQNFRHQQNLTALRFSVLILIARYTKTESLKPLIPQVLHVLASLKAPQVIELRTSDK